MQIHTKWDKPRDHIEAMIRQMRDLEGSWPTIEHRDLRQYWNRELDRVAKSLELLRQAAVSGQEMAHLTGGF